MIRWHHLADGAEAPLGDRLALVVERRAELYVLAVYDDNDETRLDLGTCAPPLSFAKNACVERAREWLGRVGDALRMAREGGE